MSVIGRFRERRATVRRARAVERALRWATPAVRDEVRTIAEHNRR
ncbi:MAG TPA: hypothetical protein VES42_16805 [Pilimelia sp.]|nr:hypothetical protein [Pilimelia sp.]